MDMVTEQQLICLRLCSGIMTYFERLTLNQIQDILEQETDVIHSEIVIIPNEGVNSDADSGEEDEVDLSRLSRNQLLSTAESKIRKIVDGEIVTVLIGGEDNREEEEEHGEEEEGERGGGGEEEERGEEEEKEGDGKEKEVEEISREVLSLPSGEPSTINLGIRLSENNSTPKAKRGKKSKSPASSLEPKVKKKKVSTSAKRSTNKNPKKKNPKPNKKTYTWVKKDIPRYNEKEFELPDWLKTSDGSPVKLFELFYDQEIIDLICENTNQNAFQNGEHNLKLSSDETKDFLAILLLSSGYCQVPRLRMYWEQSPDCNNQAVSNAMSRNRFTQIMKYFHVCDNHNLKIGDRFAKITPLWEKINEKWLQFYPGDTNVSVDESMIPYYGRHGAKQHMHGKPIRFGFKAWCLCTRLGYLINSIPYQGKKTGNTHPDLGLGGSVVLGLLDKLPNKEISVFFDNFFTSVPLLIKLKELGFHGTGTLRANRTVDAPLPSKKEMKQLPRGSHIQVTNEESGITLVRYHDNNVVTMASTQAGSHPVGKVKRFSQSTKNYINVDQPACFVLYNAYMGGVDRLDENIAKLRVNIRGKKWYWQLLCFPLNVSVNNAWQLHRYAVQNKAEQLDLLRFTRVICQTYLQKYSQRLALGRPPRLVNPVESRVAEEMRFDKVSHFLVSNEKQSRCAQCKKNARLKCNVALHQHCFERFHYK